MEKNFDKTQRLIYAMKPLSFEKMGDKLIRVSCYLIGTGINRNYSNITKEAIKRANKKLAHMPVVGHLIKDSNGDWYLGSHDFTVEVQPQIEFKPLTVPLGCVAGDKEFEFVNVYEESTGVTREYLKVELIIWNHMSPIMEAAFSEDVYFNESVEIDNIEGDWDETNNFRIDSFEYDKICLLGLDSNKSSIKHSEPCFPEAKCYPVHYSNGADFNKQFQLLLDEIQLFKSGGLSPSDFRHKQKTKKEDGNMELNPAIIAKLKASLDEHTFKSNTGKTYGKYAFVCVTDKNVTFYDREDTYKSYTAPYIVTQPSENEFVVAVDFDAKTENSISSEFSIQKEVDTISTDRASFAVAEHESSTVKDLLAKLELKDIEFATLKAQSDVQKGQIEVFVKEKEESKKKAHVDTINTIISSFATLIGKNADFDEYRARLDYSKSTEEVEQDCKLMLANQTLANDKSRFAKFGYNGVESGIVGNKNLLDDPMRARYGDAFDKF